MFATPKVSPTGEVDSYRDERLRRGYDRDRALRDLRRPSRGGDGALGAYVALLRGSPAAAAALGDLEHIRTVRDYVAEERERMGIDQPAWSEIALAEQQAADRKRRDEREAQARLDAALDEHADLIAAEAQTVPFADRDLIAAACGGTPVARAPKAPDTVTGASGCREAHAPRGAHRRERHDRRTTSSNDPGSDGDPDLDAAQAPSADREGPA